MTKIETIIDKLMFFAMLPISLTRNSKSKLVRVMGVLCMALWWPFMAMDYPILFFFVIIKIFQDI